MEKKKSIDLIFLGSHLWENKKLVIIVPICTALIAMIISLLLPKTYTASVTILAPEYEFGGGPSSMMMGIRMTNQLPITSQTVIAFLNSSKNIGLLVKQFDLVKVFKVKEPEDAGKKLVSLTNIINKEMKGLIIVEVNTRNPKLSADIANAYVYNLETINSEVRLSSRKPLVRVIDWAEPPKRKSKPKHKNNTMIGGMVGLMGILFYIYAKVLYKIAYSES